MNYLQNDLGLDRAAAALMYRAERLQEKGQTAQACRYFREVLRLYPDCTEALVNVRMLQEEVQGGSQLQQVPESSPSTNASFSMACEMDVFWGWTVTSRDHVRGGEWSIGEDEVTMDQAITTLQQCGYATPVLSMLKLDKKRSRNPCPFDGGLDGTDYDTIEQQGWGTVSVSGIGKIFVYEMEIDWAWPMMSPGVKLTQEGQKLEDGTSIPFDAREVAVKTAWAQLRSRGMMTPLLSCLSFEVLETNLQQCSQSMVKGHARIRVGHAPGAGQNRALASRGFESEAQQ